MATHRLCDATIAFTVAVLEECIKNSNKVSGFREQQKAKANEIIRTLQSMYGSGTNGLKGVANQVGNLFQNGSNWGSADSFLKQMGKAFTNRIGNIMPNNPTDLANKVGTYLNDIFAAVAVSGKADVTSQLTSLVTNDSGLYDAATLHAPINEVKKNLTPPQSKGFVTTVLQAGKSEFMRQLENKNKYVSYYDDPQIAKWTDRVDEQKRCAKIFMGCLPLIFNHLSHVYWKCHASKGAWKNMTLGGGSNGWDLYYFMCSMGYSSSDFNRGMAGSRIFTSAQQNFQDFSEGINTAQTSFPKFRSHLHTKGKENLEHFTNRPLSVLHYIGSLYFKARQSSSLVQSTHLPQTIREMLYFLAALQFSPVYEEFDKYITEYFKTLTGNQSGKKDDLELKLQVADSNVASTVSGTSASSSGDALSAADLKSYLITSCSLSSGVLGIIQGTQKSGEASDLWLHDLYSNGLNLRYPPSAPALFSAISNYAYALQFQLGFLHKQCEYSYDNARGWYSCRYGKNSTGSNVKSHLCPQQDRDCSTSSPLQAFLTDCLPGFSRGHPSSHSGHLAACSGSLCHVPMGFKTNDLKGSGVGHHIYYSIYAFCGNSNTPLPQLSEKLGCLTKRTPRTLGDMFGFIWHLNGQLFKKAPEKWVLGNQLDFTIESQKLDVDSYALVSSVKEKIVQFTPQSNKSGIVESLLTITSCLPFWQHIFLFDASKSIPLTLFNLKGTGHSRDYHPDLTSLYSAKCNQQNQNCGPYLHPLTHSEGATYAPKNASAYLSWVLYLTDDLQSWFQEMTDEIPTVQCTNNNGSHRASPNCSCSSVVECSGVLPLLYRHNFRFFSAFQLKGRSSGVSGSKRSCEKFHNILTAVLTPDAPLDKLITTIDAFLYLFRFYFFYNLSTFWLCSLAILLYFIFYGIDLLHLKSHVRFPSSHGIAPISLLGTRKAPALTKFTKLT